MPRRTSYDRWLFLTAGLLVLGGLLMVASASQYVTERHEVGRHYFLMRQAMWLFVGTIALGVMMSIPYAKLADRRLVGVLMAGSFLALAVVLTMPEFHGARRWLLLGPFRVQPSEFVKLVAIVFAASLLGRKEDRVHEFWAVPFPCIAWLMPLVFLIVIEPDLGSAVMLAGTVCVMIFVAGLPWRHVAAIAGVGGLGVVLGILAQPYRVERILAFLRASDHDINTLDWQLQQSLIALGSGGFTGLGLGQGRQKMLFLPEPHTDFIYAVIGEEFGLLGTVLVLLAFLVLFWRGLRAAAGAPDRFGFYLALGLTTLLVFQGLINMGVCVGLLPTKGLALPYVSYGGSSLVATLAATGVLLNVSQHSN